MFGAGFRAPDGEAVSASRTRCGRQQMVDFLAGNGLDGATVLEIGGGVGEIGIELLRRGAASVTNVELSSAYDVEARRLADRAGVAERVHRLIVDVAATRMRSSRPTSSCCTGSSAATRTTSGCWAWPQTGWPQALGVQPSARAMSSAAPSSRCKNTCSWLAARSSGRFATRHGRWSPS